MLIVSAIPFELYRRLGVGQSYRRPLLASIYMDDLMSFVFYCLDTLGTLVQLSFRDGQWEAMLLKP